MTARTAVPLAARTAVPLAARTAVPLAARTAVPLAARAAVPVLIAAFAPGCLDDPPTFAPRGQIPPFIVAGQVSPPLNLIYDGPAEFSVNVPFRSEDVNIDLRARLYRDLVPGVTRASHDVEQDIAAGIYEDTSRSVTMDWRSNVRLEGCHSITMILTYENNFDPISLLPIDDSRAARVVWWLNIDGESDDAPLSSCPQAPQSDSE